MKDRNPGRELNGRRGSPSPEDRPDLSNEDVLKRLLLSHDSKDIELLRLTGMDPKTLTKAQHYAHLRAQAIAEQQEHGRGFFEPQVAEAVRVLQAKGYQTISSGFGFGVAGWQHIKLTSPQFVVTDIETLGRNWSERFGIEVRVTSQMLSFLPRDLVSLAELKTIWDQIAENIPSAR